MEQMEIQELRVRRDTLVLMETLGLTEYQA